MPNGARALRVIGQAGLLLFLLVTGVAIASALTEQQKDQVQRDLTRVISEVYQRAQSRAILGEVVRPKYGSPKIDLPPDAVRKDWRPDCEVSIVAEPVEPAEHPFALVLVPPDEIGKSGASFVAYAIFAGANPLPAGAFDPPLSDWMTAAIGGYQELGPELTRITDRSMVSFKTTDCLAYTIVVVTGRPR